uniref:Uncharacterized protein n=1 Tax=Romanomermis culicivorax TaxID=13658 RepID=A0A915HJK7_ROMCU
RSGATYAVYQAEGTYSPHVSYYQNSSVNGEFSFRFCWNGLKKLFSAMLASLFQLTYQPQAVLHSIPSTPYALGGHTTGSGIGLQEDDSTPQNFNHTTRASPATARPGERRVVWKTDTVGILGASH